MATNIFRGDSVAEAQINQVIPANCTIGNIFTLTCNTKSVSYTCSVATVANVTAGLVAAVLVAQTTILEFNDFIPVDNTTSVSLTASIPGVPFTQTSSAATGTGTPGCTLVTSTPTPSEGPHHWDDEDNWSLGTIPVNTDDVVITNSSIDILYGISQASVTLNSLTITSTYTGNIGNLDINPTGNYYEYRPKYLAIGTTTCTIGEGSGSGSGRIKLNFGTVATALKVYGMAASPLTGIPALLVNGSNASNTVELFQGSHGFAIDPGSTANFPVINLGYINSSTTDVNVRFGSGCSLTTINQEGGIAEINSSFTTLNMRDGTTTVKGAAAGPTINFFGGTIYWMSTGAIGNVNGMTSTSTLDFTKDLSARSVTGKIFMNDGASLFDRFSTVTWPTVPNGLHIPDISKVNIDLGRNQIYTPTAY